MSDGEQRSDLG